MNATAKPDAPTAADTAATRDMFAAHALAALIAGPKLAGVPRADMDGMAKQAYEYADAMIKARAR
ncbi:MAG: hypothetical protein K0M70_14205 [Arenimonas sp.]|uniref:hypothetical protein n=1 Tax=Arenimonas sp. TaxID=1872635 RepID=UPI0025C08AC5|nr:hypothetical protein [Arenimonas sp.]MBW8368996.1 hypothetical protein [Arenimonas sp.]